MVNKTDSGAQLNPMEHIFAHKLVLIDSGQRFIKGSVNSQSQRENFSAPTKNIIYQELTTRLPKRSNPYGNGGSILGHRPWIQSMTKVTQLSRSFMDAAGNGTSNAMKLGFSNGKYTNLYKLICSKDLLIQAYKNVRINSGSMTPGIDNLTFDGISDKYFDKLIDELVSEKYKFTSVKRVYIPKANGKTRPLGIPTSKDKLVQEAMKIILEVIYEPKFSDVSHGFRPKRSCYTALHQISKWNGTTWMIAGYIKGFFDNVDHHILVNILSKDIKDQRFFDLLWKLFRAGYIDGGLEYNTITGVPQGGTISPILSNIYLNAFDSYVTNLCEEFSTKGKLISKVNPLIVNYSNKLLLLDKKYQKNKDKDILKKIKKLRTERNTIPSRIRTGFRVRYVRYADDWLIGISGNKALALQIKELCKNYLKNNLNIELNEEKTKITNVLRNNVKFLGVDIKRNISKEAKIIKKIIRGKLVKSRINNTRLHFYMPVLQILDRLQDAGFTKVYVSKSGEKKLVSNAITKWIFLDHKSIILRYNAVIRGLLNYYCFVDNKYSFHSIINFFIHHSCAKTLARKLKLRNRAQAFAKFGRYLEYPKEGELKSIKLLTEKNFKKNTKLLTKYVSSSIDPFQVTNWSLRTQVTSFELCWICGLSESVEMHHVKHIRKGDIKYSGSTSLMSKFNRRQIPVCKNCHKKIHSGLYNGLGLKDLYIKKQKEKPN